ncbi:hypothetical protein A2U01_0112909, partial [Trifolium medium]|nr:hypothetical protein [Trifolium medium]
MESDISGLMNMETEKQERIHRDIVDFVKSRIEAIRSRKEIIIGDAYGRRG